jgi:capsule polysaccharide export protein KpsE/RkpR
MKLDSLKNLEIFRNYFAIDYKTRKNVGIFFLGFMILIGLYLLIAPYKYTTVSSILPPKQTSTQMIPSNLLSTMNLPTGISNLGSGNLSAEYSEVLKSYSVFEFVYDSLKLNHSRFFKGLKKNKIYDIYRTNMDVVVNRSGIIYITFVFGTHFLPSKVSKDSAARLSAEIPNVAITALDYIIRQRNNSISKLTKDFIGSEITNYTAKLDSVEIEIEKFQRANKVLEIDEQTKAIFQQANQVAVDLAKAEVDYNLAQKLYAENSQNLALTKENLRKLQEIYSKIQKGGITGNDNLAIPLENIPTLIRQYTNLTRTKEIYEQVLIYLQTQYFQEAIQEKRDVPQVEILDWASIPLEKSYPAYKATIILGFVIGLAIAITFLYYSWRRQTQYQK